MVVSSPRHSIESVDDSRIHRIFKIRPSGGGRKVGTHPTREAEMAYEDFERGMGSRSRHGRKVSRRDTRGEIKTATRNGRGNNRARLCKDAFGR